MKHLVGKLVTEEVPFMGDKVEVNKLTVGQVLELQKLVKEASKSKDDSAQLQLLCDTIKLAVVGAEDITDEEFKSFPISELSELSEHIMRLAGLGGDSAGN